MAKSKKWADGRARSFRVSGQVLCSLRLARGWTQVEAAERAGISERLVRMAESGGKLGFRSIAILAQLYSTLDAPLSPEELVKESLADRADAVLEASTVETIVRRWHEELWHQGKLEVLAELAAPNCVLHAPGERLRGRASVRRYVQSTRAAWGQQFKLVVRRPAVFGNIAVARWRVQLKKPPSSPAGASEKQAATRGSTWFRVAEGLLRETWRYCDCP
jgi:transcriptional regulator with XRE-family HTH domain